MTHKTTEVGETVFFAVGMWVLRGLMDFPLAEEVRGRKQAVRPLQTVPTGQPAVQKEHPVGWEGGTPGCSGGEHLTSALPHHQER